jgi:hypothetical protein
MPTEYICYTLIAFSLGAIVACLSNLKNIYIPTYRIGQKVYAYDSVNNCLIHDEVQAIFYHRVNVKDPKTGKPNTVTEWIKVKGADKINVQFVSTDPQKLIIVLLESGLLEYGKNIPRYDRPDAVKYPNKVTKGSCNA